MKNKNYILWKIFIYNNLNNDVKYILKKFIWKKKGSILRLEMVLG